MRFVISTGNNEFVKWIHWTAGVAPRLINDSFEKALIIDYEYLELVIEKTGKTRRKLILERYPEAVISEVQVSLV